MARAAAEVARAEGGSLARAEGARGGAPTLRLMVQPMVQPALGAAARAAAAEEEVEEGGVGRSDAGTAVQRDVRSGARVLLLGTGADEQLGGYGRHQTVFRKEGWSALAAELRAERERLWLRNLGRDDRVISDCIHMYIHMYIRMYIRKYMHMYIHMYIHITR